MGSILKGRVSTYSLVKELYRSADNGTVFLAKNHEKERCILKSIPKHWRLQNEATILKSYQDRSPYLRPLLDKIQEPTEPSSIVLKYLDTDLLTESKKKRLTRPEIKQVAKTILEALQVLHQDGLVHTDIKLDNVFANHGQDGQRFSTIQLGDCGGVVTQDSQFAREGHLIGAAITRSPEASFQLHWGTATDILGLIYEDGACLFIVLKRMHKFFGPFPRSYDDFKDPGVISVINVIHHEGPPEKPFHLITTKEVAPADKKFILKIMKLDPRDRPTAEELLADEWFTEELEDTRAPIRGE
ncbi:kinase-like protein [Hypoxylon sp. EC38]|nr:kinase-like protein [Hypoxylon sp. EC38]